MSQAELRERLADALDALTVLRPERAYLKGSDPAEYLQVRDALQAALDFFSSSPLGTPGRTPTRAGEH